MIVRKPLIKFMFCARLLMALVCFLPAYSAPAADNESTNATAKSDNETKSSNRTEADSGLRRASAIFAGGCFWCIESDLEHAPGVIDVISGYSGGRTKNPTYETYVAGGHREVIFVMYDPHKVTFAGLVEFFIKHIDPLNRRGQFLDKGLQYSPAVYYETEEEKTAAESVIQAIDELKIYRGKIGVVVEKREEFWPAEAYHQNFHVKDTMKYKYFRLSTGRDAFVAGHWGNRAGILELPGAFPEGLSDQSAASEQPEAKKYPAPWSEFRKPNPTELRKSLAPIQFKVTQQDGTETAYRNSYWDNKKVGLYVDVVSGAPLFSSTAKFESGTGWPSFVAPIMADAVVFKNDRKMAVPRIEVRSRYGDSHLGHVFDDGPVNRGGKRYCMNSAALRFVPKESLEQEGYGEFLKLFEAVVPLP